MVRALQDELEVLRSAPLSRHEEKTVIHLRELERENLQLRRNLAAMEEKVRSLESEDFRSRVTDLLKPSEAPVHDKGPAVPTTSRSFRQESCAGCRMKLAAASATHRQEKMELQSKLDDALQKLHSANEEISAVQLWLQPLAVALQHSQPRSRRT